MLLEEVVIEGMEEIGVSVGILKNMMQGFEDWRINDELVGVLKRAWSQALS